MKKILITGGSGFIGTNLTEYFLLQKKYELLNVDIKPSGLKEIQDITKLCDIRDFDKLRKIIKDFDPNYIIHLAARTDLDGKTLDDYSSNILGVQNIIKIASSLKNLKKILVTSSMIVCKGGYTPKSQTDYCPNTKYGESKVETEKITRNANLSCDWAIIRPTSIWGPHFGEPYRNFFDMVRAKHYFHIGNTSCTKTYGYVGNAVYQLESILLNDTSNNPNKVYYLGDKPSKIEEWANEIAAEENHKIFKMPYILIKLAANAGDVLKKIGISFPMTNFRLNNMTTDNIIDLSNTDKIAPNRPYTRLEGVKKTIEWLKYNYR